CCAIKEPPSDSLADHIGGCVAAKRDATSGAMASALDEPAAHSFQINDSGTVRQSIIRKPMKAKTSASGRIFRQRARRHMHVISRPACFAGITSTARGLWALLE